MLFFATVLLFARLGHYALWDDEANTALIAEGICETGDTSAVIGRNLVAYEGGWELKNLRERFIPPLPTYLAAGSMAMLGRTSLAARLPFALCGVGFFSLVVIWLKRDRADAWAWGLNVFALLTNVSLILYFRQARYYGVVIFLSALLVYWYLHWNEGRGTTGGKLAPSPGTPGEGGGEGESLSLSVGSRPTGPHPNPLPEYRERGPEAAGGVPDRIGPSGWRMAFVLIAAIALFASNYLSFGALACCFLVDWCIWGRQCFRLGARQAVVMLVVFGLAAGALLSVYNPFTVPRPVGPPAMANQVLLLAWKLRDMSVNEFCAVPLIALLPFVALWRRDLWLARGGIALLVYILVIDLVEPHHSSFAALRYLATVIPLCCFLEVRTLLLAVGKRKWLAAVIGIPIFATNVLSGSTIWHPGLVNIPMRSTIAAYLGELWDPPSDPFRAAAEWVNANLPEGTTVLVLPEYAKYPLMFHAPGQVYGWQLKYPAEEQFKDEPEIQFVGREAPEYIVLFGGEGVAAYRPIKLADGSVPSYSVVKVLPVFGKDLFRPELYLRVFETQKVEGEREGILVLRRG